MPSSGKVLVTGATGFVGSNLVRMLIEEEKLDPAQVRVLVRAGSPRTWMLDGLPVERVAGSLGDKVALARALEGCERVYHAAAYLNVGTSNAERYRRTNVVGTRNLLGLAREAEVRRVVVVSSIAATALGSRARPADEDSRFDLGGFRLPYVDTKRAQELLALSESRDGLEVVVVNPGFIFGPGDVKPVTGQLLVAMARGLYPLVPPGGISAVDVRDVCRGAILAAERGTPGQRYILADRILDFRELGQLVAKVRGGSAPLGLMPGPILFAAGLCADFLTHLGFDLPFNSSVARYALSAHCTSGQRASRELGLVYRPLEETLRDAFAWFDAHGYMDWPVHEVLLGRRHRRPR